MKIYDSLLGKKKNPTLIIENHIGIYACGVTVYDHCHIGHSRSIIFMDFFVRYFRSLGYIVNYIRNITDIDDKIIEKSFKQKKTYKEIIQEFTSTMRKEEKLLQVLPPDYEPSVSNYLQEVILLTKKILKSGYAYINKCSGVYFDVSRFYKYGELSHNVKLFGLDKKEKDKNKKGEKDFVLWKKAKIGEPAWLSPWGLGRPGWHIECSAMSMSLLGDSFDFHSGGLDLKFPHHENEIAQSESVSKKTFSGLWMHVGILTISGQKMSKSLNNHQSIKSVLGTYNTEEVRFFIMSSSYRSPVNYSPENLFKARSGLSRLYNALEELPYTKKFGGRRHIAKFFHALEDDFNTPLALSILFDIARTIQQLKTIGAIEEASSYAKTLKKISSFLGILQEDTRKVLHKGSFTKNPEELESLIQERVESRKNKEWKRADEIREKIRSLGFKLKDSQDGTTLISPL